MVNNIIPPTARIPHLPPSSAGLIPPSDEFIPDLDEMFPPVDEGEEQWYESLGFMLAIEELSFEVTIIQSLNRTLDRQIQRRLYVKSIYGFIQAIACRILEDFAAYRSVQALDLTTEEEDTLRECFPQIYDNPGSHSQIRPVLTAEGIVMLFRVYSKGEGVDLEPIEHEAGWSAFKDFLDTIRPVIYPSNRDDLMIAESESETAKTAVKWFNDYTMRIKTKLLEESRNNPF